MFEFLGETLRRLRKERGLTLDQLGKQAKLGRGQLSRIENQKQEATFSTVSKILRSQGVSRREFFRRYDLVESEAIALGQEAGGAAQPAEAGWPQTMQQAASRLEAFIQTVLHEAGPVAQGAIELGDFVVLFRVVPRSGAPAAVAAPAVSGDGGKAPTGAERTVGSRARRRKR